MFLLSLFIFHPSPISLNHVIVCEVILASFVGQHVCSRSDVPKKKKKKKKKKKDKWEEDKIDDRNFLALHFPRIEKFVGRWKVKTKGSRLLSFSYGLVEKADEWNKSNWNIHSRRLLNFSIRENISSLQCLCWRLLSRHTLLINSFQ